MRERKHVLSHILGDLFWYILAIFVAVFLAGLVVYQNEPSENLMQSESIFTMLSQRETEDVPAELPTIEELSDYFESQNRDSGEINGERYERLIRSYLLPDGRHPVADGRSVDAIIQSNNGRRFFVLYDPAV